MSDRFCLQMVSCNDCAGTSGEGTAAENVYSTEEHSIGTWIDGKTIYEKTYPVYNITSPCKLAEAIENIDRVVNIGGTRKYKLKSTILQKNVNLVN